MRTSRRGTPPTAPCWAPGIPTIENVGGDVDLVGGVRCAFQAYPWRWLEGDACVVRLTAIFDPSGDYRLGAGT